MHMHKAKMSIKVISEALTIGAVHEKKTMYHSTFQPNERKKRAGTASILLLG